MPLSKVPLTGLDDINQRRRLRETINKVLDHGFDDSRVQTPAEQLAGVTPVNYAYEPGDERRYGVIADGVTDDTAALENCYAACVAGNYDMKLMIRGTRRITNQLLWNAAVDVIGVSREDVIIAKDFAGTADDGNYAIKLDVDAEQALYENFTVQDISGVGGGIDIWLGSRITIRRVICQDLDGHGILLRAGNLGLYQSIICRRNSGCGVVVASGTNPDLPAQSAWACTWIDLDCILNDEYGFNIDVGNSHFGFGVVCQHNGLGGFRSNANTNIFTVYCEQNPDGVNDNDVVLTSSSIRNIVTINNALNPAAIQDEGTNNIIVDCAVFATISTPNVYPITRTSNAAGRALLVRGGFAGAGAVGRAGGKLQLQGGEAQGTAGAAAGGDVELEGALGVNGGARGTILIKSSNITHGRLGITYSASMTPNARSGKYQAIRANNGVAFTINAPINPREADELAITVTNVSGGALGAAAWDAAYHMSAWTNPATGFHRTITFYYEGSFWDQVAHDQVDIAN